jgi:hypothetical protein
MSDCLTHVRQIPAAARFAARQQPGSKREEGGGAPTLKRHSGAEVYWRTAMQQSMETLTEKYARRGHPTVDEMIAAQGLSFPRDPADLLGNSWPEEESIDDFLNALHEWRGRE